MDLARPPGLTIASPAGRWAVAATVAGSAVAMITSTVVNVALPEIAEGLSTDTAGVQWVINAYLLPLAALILLGGALGDRLGRRRVYVAGVVLFGAASVAAAAAPTLGWLLAARAVMGVGGALLTPGSLALLEASFVPADRAAAIGAWSGLGGVAAAVGPLVGGLLLDVAGWRLLFLVNLPVCAAAVLLAHRHLPESHDPTGLAHPPDWRGSLSAVVGLGLLTWGLIGLGEGAAAAPIGGIAAGLLVLGLFVVLQRRVPGPLVPPDVVADRTFAVANALTFVVYAALGGVMFLLVVFLRQVLGYSGLQAGAATLPVTVVMLLLSARVGRLATRIGPRTPLTIGPLLLALGMAWYAWMGPGATYLTGVLPGMLVFSAGLVLLVAPVTATVLAAVDARHAGVASGINNAVARTAGLLAVALLPPAAGLGPAAFADASQMAVGFARAMGIAAVLALAGSAIAWVGLPRDLRPRRRVPHQPEAHEQPHARLDCPPPVRDLPSAHPPRT